MANDKKSELLGLNYSSASSSLRKQIIFHLAGQLGLLDCHRCGTVIELEDFSIEHKDSWMSAEDPKAVFFDIENIAFSHLRCNSASARRPNKVYENASERRTAEWNRLDKEKYAERRKSYPSRKKDYNKR